jgi:outer membrane porin, OprD family
MRSAWSIALPAVVIGLWPLFPFADTSALAQETPAEEEAPAPLLGEEVTHMDETFKEERPRPGGFPRLEEKLKDAPPFFRDGTVDFNLRTYYFSSKDFNDAKSEAWALGGSMTYRSGLIRDRFGMGAALYTSQPLYAPDDRDGTKLLQSGQKGYTVVGQLYGRINIVERNFVDLYRFEVNTPFINKNDGRMSPNTFEAYGFQGHAGDRKQGPEFAYGGGYIAKIKPRNSETFIPMSKEAGADVKRGVTTAGLRVSSSSFSIGAIDYYSNDIINIGYAEADYTAYSTGRFGLDLSAQFTDQRSVGDDLLTGDSFATNQAALMAKARHGGGTFTLAYSRDSSGADLQSPWGGYPGYTSVQVQDFKRAGESAFMVKGSYEFSLLGLDGLAGYLLWVHGWGAVDPDTGLPVYNQNEYNGDLQWRPKTGSLKGLWIRLRYAHVDQWEHGDSTDDELRVIINYDLPLL